ncbi:MAG: carbohydrate binding domain-containing protein [Bacteroidetes bacterium]|nr:carbohydrate binding domain-containing protein [Bacteroidota bacterium]
MNKLYFFTIILILGLFPQIDSLGQNLVTNGTFESDISGWSAKDAVISHETAFPITGAGSMEFDNSTGNSSGGFYQDLSLAVNSVYRITGNSHIVSGGNQDLQILQVAFNGTGQENPAILVSNAIEGSDVAFDIRYTTSSTPNRSALEFSGSATNSVIRYDDLTVELIKLNAIQ